MNYIPTPQYLALSHACHALWRAFSSPPYLVGSSLSRPDFRDVDVRLILADEEFDAMFPDLAADGLHPFNAATGGDGVGLIGRATRWGVICMAIAAWLSQQSGLLVDFQIQRRTQANADFGGERQPLGMGL